MIFSFEIDLKKKIKWSFTTTTTAPLETISSASLKKPNKHKTRTTSCRLCCGIISSESVFKTCNVTIYNFYLCSFHLVTSTCS